MRRSGLPERIYVETPPLPHQTAALSLQRHQVVAVDVLQTAQHGDACVQLREQSQVLRREEVLELLLLVLELENGLHGGLAGGSLRTEGATRRHVLDVSQREERRGLRELHSGLVERRELCDDAEDELRLQLLRADDGAAPHSLGDVCEDLFNTLR